MQRSAKARLSPRPQLPKISEEMRRWCDFLLAEVTAWPRVTSRPMFGMMAVYRGSTIFGVVPRTRAMDAPSSVAFKLPRSNSSLKRLLEGDPRIILPHGKHVGWISFELRSEHDIADAVVWFERAYRGAGKTRKPA